jgi:hypothetical protein
MENIEICMDDPAIKPHAIILADAIRSVVSQNSS